MRRARLPLIPGLLALLATACGQAADHAPPAAAEVAAAPNDSLTLPTESDGGGCVGVEVTAERAPVDLFAVLDGSSSMNELTASGVSKWAATKTAFRDFLAGAPAGMGFGLSVFPLPGDSSSCLTDDYSDDALRIDDVAHMAQGALARLDAVKPQGRTPTAPALTAALALATDYGVAHPERSVVVVLATDGLPTACAPTDAAGLAVLARAALEGPAHVRTLVVASPELTNSDMSGFERIAIAGGTLRPLSIDGNSDFVANLSSALGAAATRRVACDLALPEPPAGQRLDYDAVNVVLDGEQRTTVPRVAGVSKCGQAGGWYYDVDPAEGAPSRLNICRAACERATTATKLRVELGCKTVVR